MKKSITMLLMLVLVSLTFATVTHADNPVIKERFSADPAALVHDGKAYLYVGHDEASTRGNFFVLKEWNIYSSTDMTNWELEGSLPRTEFEWAKNDSAWASQAIERDGKFYWYVTVFNGDPNDPGYAIGVAESDHPVEGWEDAIGGPLVTASMTEDPVTMGSEPWDDIDPTVFIDDDGQAYLYWGNTHLYYAKLKDNMVELDGDIHKVDIQNMPGTFTEGPFLHEYNGNYYQFYAMNYPEELAYAMSDSPEGPWEYKGKLMDTLPDSATSHPAILEFEGESYFIYHTAALPTGGEYRRSVSIEEMHYNPDGTIDKFVPTASGISDPSYALQAYNDDNRYIRHLDDELRVDPVEGNTYDSKWHPVSGLADDSEGYVSFQSENNPGFYLVRDGSSVELAKHDGTESFEENATFKEVPGLADADWSSFQAYNDEELYLFQLEDYRLRLSTVDSEEQNGNATFRLMEADATGIELDKDFVSIQEGTKTTLVATVTPEEALQKKVNYYSTNPEVATVSNSSYNPEDGKTTVTVTGKSAGTAKIIAITEDGNYSSTVEIEVEEFVSGPVVMENVVITGNSTTKEVNIEGYLQDQSGKNVTVKVTSPEGDIDYVDQTITDEDGKFTFAYKLNNEVEGTYSVAIGAADFDAYQSSFNFTPASPGDETPGDGDKIPGDGDKTPGDGDKTSENGDKTPGNGDETSGDIDDEGKDLPDTATNLYNYLLAGVILLVLGGAVTLYARKRRTE